MKVVLKQVELKASSCKPLFQRLYTQCGHDNKENKKCNDTQISCLTIEHFANKGVDQ